MTESDGRLPNPVASEALSLPPSNARQAVEHLPNAGRVGPAADPVQTRRTPVSTVAVQSVDSKRRDRIRHTTAGGGLVAVPDDFADWDSVLSEDPFEVLYLDHEEEQRVTPDLVQRHFVLLSSFWQKRIDQIHQGKHGIVVKYGGPFQSDKLVMSYPNRLRESAERLSSTEGIENERGYIRAARKRTGAEAIDQVMWRAFADGTVDQDESRNIFAAGRHAGLRDDEIAESLQDAITKNGFVPNSTPKGDTIVDRLQSVSWTRRGDKSAVDALKFSNGRAASLAELVDLCDTFPDEAQDHLYSGYLEKWLTGTMNHAGLARTAREAKKRSTTGRRDLELFVRELCRQADREALPRIVAMPPICSLGSFPIGATARSSVQVAAEGRTYAWGKIVKNPALPGLRVPTEFDTGNGVIELLLDTLTVPAGTYESTLSVQPEGGPASEIRVQYSVLALALSVDHPKVDLGAIPFGDSRAQKLTLVSTPAGGRLTGTVAIAAPRAGISIQHTPLSEGSDIELAVDTRELTAGQSYHAVIRVESNAGILDVPVSFKVLVAKETAIAWSVGSSVVLGAAMWFARTTMASADRALTDWYVKFQDTPELISFGIAASTLALTVYGTMQAFRNRRQLWSAITSRRT